MSEMLDNIRGALINQDNIIPVIGYEMLPIKNDDGQHVPYLEYLSRKIVTERNLPENDNNGNILINFQEMGFVLFNQVMHALLKSNEFDYLSTTKDLSTFVSSIHHDVDTIYLEEIVKIRPFKYFFNLTFTTHLSEAVGKLRSFPGIAVKQSLFPFTLKNPKKPDDLIKSDCSYEGIVYNIAGLAYSHTNNTFNKLYNFIYSDDDLLELIPEFTKRYGVDLNNYKEVIEETSLLFLGCQYPDWLTRILIKTLKPGALMKINAAQARIFFDYCNDNSNSFFLSKHKFTFQRNVITTKLVEELFNYLTEDGVNLTISPKNDDFIFISYTRDNLQLVKSIVCQLAMSRNVWFDRIKMFPGDMINDEVKTGIINCKLFLPVITNESVNKSPNDYVRQEWIFYKEQFQNKSKVIPLVHKNVNLGALGFNIDNEFAVWNIFRIEIDDNGLTQQGIDNITNRV